MDLSFEKIAQRSEALAEEKWCPFCQSRMVFHDSEISRWPSLNPLAYINNVTLKCPDCKFLARFGIQVSKEWFDEAVKLRGAVRTISVFDRFLEKTKEDNAAQRKRLQALGYL